MAAWVIRFYSIVDCKCVLFRGRLWYPFKGVSRVDAREGLLSEFNYWNAIVRTVVSIVRKRDVQGVICHEGGA